MYKLNNNQNGFGAVEAVLVLLILGIIGFASYFVWHAKQSTDKSLAPIGSTASTRKKDTTGYSIPADYIMYRNAGISFAYPKAWNSAMTTDYIKVIDDSQAEVYQGCGDEACAVRYDHSSETWKGQNVGADSGTKSVASSGNIQAYLIPIKGEMNCGSWGLFIHQANKFAQATMSLCTKPTGSDALQPSNGQLPYEDIVNQLQEVVKTVNKV